MSDHTRGPWRPSDINDGLLPRNEADVILMAAAPDLLAALEDCLKLNDIAPKALFDSIHGRAREVIAKAKGD